MKETFNIKTSCFDEVGTGLFTNRLENDTSNIAYVFDTLTSKYCLRVSLSPLASLPNE